MQASAKHMKTSSLSQVQASPKEGTMVDVNWCIVDDTNYIFLFGFLCFHVTIFKLGGFY